MRAALLAAGVLALFFPGSIPAQWQAPNLKDADAIRDYRADILKTAPAAMGIKPTKEFPILYGVLMEWPQGQKTALAGAVIGWPNAEQPTLLLSSTQGAEGLLITKNHNGPPGLWGDNDFGAVAFAKVASDFIAASTPATNFNDPAPGRVHFYLLTFQGVRVIDTGMAAISDGTSAYGKLFSLGQKMVKEVSASVPRNKGGSR